MLHSITDVHAHYDEAVFDTDRGEVLRTLREAGVCAIVNSGSSVPSSRRSLDLAKRFEGVYASVGVFPLEAYNVPSGWLCGRWRDRTGLPFGGWRRSHIRAAGDAKKCISCPAGAGAPEGNACGHPRPGCG